MVVWDVAVCRVSGMWWSEVVQGVMVQQVWQCEKCGAVGYVAMWGIWWCRQCWKCGSNVSEVACGV